MKRRRLLCVVLMMIMLLVMSLNVQAATKSVKNIFFETELTNVIAKNATVVKEGITTLKLKQNGNGYVRFKAPATKTYTFTFYGQTGPKYGHNNGYAYIMTPVKKSFGETDLEKLTFSTQGGKATTAWFHTKLYADTKKSIDSFLERRNCKIKLKDSQIIYIYIHFAESGTIKLSISGNGAIKVGEPYLSESEISVKTKKTYKLSVKGASTKVKWSSSNKAVATVSSSGKVTGRKAGTATIIARVGAQKLKCKVTVKGSGTKSNIAELQKITAFYLDYLVDEALKDPDSLKVRNIWSGYTAGNKTPCTVVEYTANNSFGGVVRSYACIFKDTSQFSRIATSIKYSGKYYVTAFTSKTKTDSVIGWKKMDVQSVLELTHFY